MPKFSLQSLLFKLVPETEAKNYLRCFLYNRAQKDFTIAYQQKKWVITYAGHTFYFAENPFHVLKTTLEYFIKQKPQPGDTVIDAGAFVGDFTLISSKFVGPAGHVFAFEPDPETLVVLRKNLELNNAKNVTVIEKGLWSEETELKFKKGLELASGVAMDAADETGIIQIPVTTIDSVLANHQVKNQVFVKMNIEGSEIEALKGARQTMARYKPHWVIRTDHLVNGAFTDKRVEEILKSHGYKTETVQLADLTTYGL